MYKRQDKIAIAMVSYLTGLTRSESSVYSMGVLDIEEAIANCTCITTIG